MKIVLMGTSDFVMPAFKRLASKHEIIAVYTPAPKPFGRKGDLKKSEIHLWAEENKFPVETPKSLRPTEEIELLQSYAKKADLAVLAVYGLYVPLEAIKAFRLGILNIHPSLLPKYRGASPMYNAVLNGDTETGVSIMQLDEGFDSGDVLMQKKINIGINDTMGDIYKKLSNISADLITTTLDSLNSLTPVPQLSLGSDVSYTDKLTRDDEKINWNNSSNWVHNRIRGLNPTPKAYATSNGLEYKIIESRLSNREDPSKQAGEIIEMEMDGAIVKCGTGAIKILKIQPAGKKIMSMLDFLHGQKQFKGFDR